MNSPRITLFGIGIRIDKISIDSDADPTPL